MLAGRDVFDVEGCWQAMLPSTFDILRERKLATQAMACVDSAHLGSGRESAGAAALSPLGWLPEPLPIIAIGGYYDRTTRSSPRRCRATGNLDSRAEVQGRRATPEEDAERFRAARDAAGPTSCSRPMRTRARPCAKRCSSPPGRGLDMRWFEEPCRWQNDRRAMRDVRISPACRWRPARARFAAGARDLMLDGAIDVCNFDASWAGGPTEWRRVAAMASALDMQMGHHEEPQISAHLLAAIPHGTYVECFHPERDPILWNLIANRPEIRDGLYRVPQRRDSASSWTRSTWIATRYDATISVHIASMGRRRPSMPGVRDRRRRLRLSRAPAGTYVADRVALCRTM